MGWELFFTYMAILVVAYGLVSKEFVVSVQVVSALLILAGIFHGWSAINEVGDFSTAIWMLLGGVGILVGICLYQRKEMGDTPY